MSSLVQWDGSSTPTRGGARTPVVKAEPVRAIAYSRATTNFSAWADLPDKPPPPAGTVWDVARDEIFSGSLVQTVTGWALGTRELEIRTYARPLLRTDDRRLHPARPWALQAHRSIPVTGLVRLLPAAASETVAQTTTVALIASADRIVEALPAAVRKLLDNVGGERMAYAILQRNRGVETVWALAIGDQSVVAVRAERRWARRPVGPWDLAVWRAERTNPAAAQIDAGRTKQLER